MTNLRHFRQEKELTQADMAKRLGISQPLLAQVELGDRKPYRKLLKKAAVILRIPYSALEPDLRQWKRKDYERN